MATTCTRLLKFFCVSFTLTTLLFFTGYFSPAQAQSLEDKVSLARKLQAQSQLDDGQVDSLVADRKAKGQTLPTLKNKRTGLGLEDKISPDSLLSGPTDSLQNDSTDSIGTKNGKTVNSKSKKLAQAKRYEQRIFGSLDRSAFNSASGAAGRGYLLGPGDEITVSLWGDKEKEYSLQVNKEGKIFLEGIGILSIAGNNLDQAQQILKTHLSKVYSGINRGSAHVEVSLGKAGPIRVFVLGEVKVPGGFVFSGHTSVLSAIYYAKGPTDIGTVRNMTLTRSGNKFNIDLYKYLIRGETLTPNSLQDGDILFSARAEALVEIEGDIGRPAIYELKKGEGVKELLEFGGNLNPTAATHKLTLHRIFENGKHDVQDLPPPQDFISGKAKIELRDGDKITVEKSTEESRNFFTITGPVKYPGTYEAKEITTVNKLIERAGGLREDAYLGRLHIVRFKPDGSSTLLSFSLDNTDVDTIHLEPKDNVLLYSIKDMYLPDSVQIAGAVFNPGRFEYREGISVKDLIMQAGGFLPHHESGRVLIFRGNLRERKVEQIDLNMEEGLAKNGSGFILGPNDFVQVPVDPRWYTKEIVTLDGLFQHPGKYALLFPGEKLTSVIERAGGFKENGYVEGGRFFRSKDNVGRVGVDLSKALKHPKTKANIPLVGGDSIYVPEKLNTVKVIGEVGFETSLLVQEGADVQYYIDHAGGFTRRSEKDRVVVQYANGETGRDGYFNRKPDAGSVIYVPQGPEPKQPDWFAGINAILGTMGVALAVILSIQALNR